MPEGYITYFGHLAKQVLHAPELKWLSGFLVSVFAFFFDPVQQLALISLFCLVIFDFAFGVVASCKSGEQVRSARIRVTGFKLVAYFSLIAAARITEHALPVMPFLDEFVTGYFAATELWSILENAGRIGYAVPQKVVRSLGAYLGNQSAVDGKK